MSDSCFVKPVPQVRYFTDQGFTFYAYLEYGENGNWLWAKDRIKEKLHIPLESAERSYAEISFEEAQSLFNS